MRLLPILIITSIVGITPALLHADTEFGSLFRTNPELHAEAEKIYKNTADMQPTSDCDTDPLWFDGDGGVYRDPINKEDYDEGRSWGCIPDEECLKSHDMSADDLSIFTPPTEKNRRFSCTICREYENVLGFKACTCKEIDS